MILVLLFVIYCNVALLFDLQSRKFDNKYGTLTALCEIDPDRPSIALSKIVGRSLKESDSNASLK